MDDDPIVTAFVARPRRPRGDRVPLAEVERRCEVVESLLARGRGRSQVIAALKKQGIHPRTAERYIHRVRTHWNRDEAEAAPSSRQAMLAWFSAVARKLEATEQWASFVRLTDQILRLRGLDAPIRVEHSGSVAHVHMTVEEACAELDRRLADGALRLGAGNGASVHTGNGTS